jgi:HD-GYP domain-containing protein (c-di-GMP phosphodiesterase class II)
MQMNNEKIEEVEEEFGHEIVRKQFSDLGIKIEEYPEIFERLTEIDGSRESHFYDSAKMAEMIDLLWEKLELKGISREKMKLCALLHDIGKSGPEKSSPRAHEAVKKLFQHKPFKDSSTKPIRVALRDENFPGREEIEKILGEELGIDVEKERMIDFWRRHVDWTYEILQAHKGGPIDDEVISVASSHHILDGKNPAGLSLETIPSDAKVLEAMDKYQILTLIDKYQAYRGRSAYSHEEAIQALEEIVAKSSLPKVAEKEYLRFIKILAESKKELEESFS